RRPTKLFRELLGPNLPHFEPLTVAPKEASSTLKTIRHSECLSFCVRVLIRSRIRGVSSMLSQPTCFSLRGRDLAHVPASPALLKSAASVGRYRPRRIVCPVSLREESTNWAVQIAYLLAQEHV